MSRHVRVAATAVALGAVLMVACGDDDPAITSPSSTTSTVASVTSTTSDISTTTTSAGRVLEYTYSAGQVTGDDDRVEVSSGETLTIRVTSDVAEEIHVHTYDLHADLQPGIQGELTFEATINGVHEVELEDAQRLLFSLVVQ